MPDYGDRFSRRGDGAPVPGKTTTSDVTGVPGKTTLTQLLPATMPTSTSAALGPAANAHVPVQRKPSDVAGRASGAPASSSQGPLGLPHLQLKAPAIAVAEESASEANGSPADIAAPGVAGGGEPLPHLAQIQASFGHHDVSGVTAHQGPAAANAARALGASAFAVGHSVAFDGAPDLHTAAHEAAHVVQQRSGVQLKGGIDGGAPDPYERHADQVADAVVAGQSAAPLLDQMAGGASAGSVVQRTPPKHLAPDPNAPAPSNTIVLPDEHHPTKRDVDGEQVIQTYEKTEPGKPAPLRGKSWKTLAEVAESVNIQDDSGDTLYIDSTYRLESRPAEVGEVPDIWIHTERLALLTIGSGEHVGATIVGQARIRLAPGEARDPKVAITRASIGADHWAQIYLAEAAQYVNLFGPRGRPSLLADAADNDVFAYGDPLRTLIGLKNILKQQHVAGHGADVASMHAQAQRLLADTKRGRVVVEREIASITTSHDPQPGNIAGVRFLVGDIGLWLATNQRAGRDHTEDARLLTAARDELEALLAKAEHAHAPKRDQLDDALMAPVRFGERTAEGAAEVGEMIVDATVLAVDAAGKATGIGTFDYRPISKYGKSIDATGASTTTALVTMVNGFADQWSDALARAKHGDYRGLTDVSIDTLMMVDGARAGGMIALEKGEALVAKLGSVARSAHAIVSKLPSEVSNIAAAMADGADAFAARLRVGRIETATAGGGPGPKLGGLRADTLADAAQAAKEAFTNRRLAQSAATQPAHTAAPVESAAPHSDTAAPASSGDAPRTDAAKPRAAAQTVETTHDPAAVVSKPNIAIGDRLQTIGEAEEALSKLAAGDRSAFTVLGMEAPPETFDSRSLEWGIGQLPDGSLVIIRGDAGSVNWSGFPGVRPIAHSHPFVAARSLGQTARISDIISDRLGEAAKIHTFPSARDIAFTAENALSEHTVQTPYASKGNGLIGDPARGTNEPLVQMRIRDAERIGSWAGNDKIGVYRSQITAQDTHGNVLWKGEVYSVDHPSGSLIMGEPPPSSLVTTGDGIASGSSTTSTGTHGAAEPRGPMATEPMPASNSDPGTSEVSGKPNTGTAPSALVGSENSIATPTSGGNADVPSNDRIKLHRSSEGHVQRVLSMIKDATPTEERQIRSATIDAEEREYLARATAGAKVEKRIDAAKRAGSAAARITAEKLASELANNAADQAIADGSVFDSAAVSPDTRTALAAYEGGSTGQAAKRLAPMLDGKRIDEMKATLDGEVAAGRATSVQEPMRDYTDATGAMMQQQEVYTFNDGSLIRVKPKGDKYNPGMPMFSIEVKRIGVGASTAGQDSIAFKIDAHGRPVPRGGNRAEIKNPYSGGRYQLQESAFEQRVLDAGHRRIATGSATLGGSRP